MRVQEDFMIKSTSNLPDGYVATFVFDDGCLTVEWSPGVPMIRNHRKLRRLVAAYTAARDSFMQDVATMIGGNVLVLDAPADTVDPATVAEPRVLH
jgi:hypothetical protein